MATDLERMIRAQGIDPNAAMSQPPPSMARGVDLNVVRNKKKFQHRWTARATYVIVEEALLVMIAEMDAAVADMKIKQAAGEPVELTSIKIPLDQDKMVHVDGPGCIKCSLHFTAPEGYGRLCTVSDDVAMQQGMSFPDPVGDEDADTQQPGLALVTDSEGTDGNDVGA